VFEKLVERRKNSMTGPIGSLEPAAIRFTLEHLATGVHQEVRYFLLAISHVSIKQYGRTVSVGIAPYLARAA